MLFCALVEVFDSTMWRSLKDAAKHSDDLKDLANSLPSVVLASRAASTVDKYSGGFTRWKVWARGHTIPILPDSPFHVALYLRYLMQDAKTISPLQTEPITLGQLDCPVRDRTSPSASLIDIRTFVATLLTFAAFCDLMNLSVYTFHTSI